MRVIGNMLVAVLGLRSVVGKMPFIDVVVQHTYH